MNKQIYKSWYIANLCCWDKSRQEDGLQVLSSDLKNSAIIASVCAFDLSHRHNVSKQKTLSTEGLLFALKIIHVYQYKGEIPHRGRACFIYYTLRQIMEENNHLITL